MSAPLRTCISAARTAPAAVAVILGTVLLTCAEHSPAADPSQPLAAVFPAALQAKLQQPGSITLRDIPLRDALLTIGEEWKVDIAFGRDLDGVANGVFQNRSLREILDTLLAINGYGYAPQGQGLVVQKLEDLGGRNAAFESVILPLPGAGGSEGVSEIVESAKMYMSKQGQIKAVPAARGLVVVDYPDRVARVRQFIQQLAQTAVASGGSVAGGAQFARIPIRHLPATAVSEALQGMASDGASISALEDVNVIVVYGPPAHVQRVRAAIQMLDKARKQVRITAYIYDVALEEMERLGINWEHSAKSRNLSPDGSPDTMFGFNSGILSSGANMMEEAADAGGGMMGGAMTGGAAATGIQAGTMTIRSLSRNFDLTTMLQALDETRGARLLSDPRIVVHDRQKATMKAVREVPFQQLTESTDGGAVGTTEFREAGVTLTVTPEVTDSGVITLNVQATFSVLAGFQDGQPIIDTREASTRVGVANQQVVALGGLRQRSEVETVTGIPGLKDWKILGPLFRSHNTTIVESELIIFIRPELVDPVTLGRDREAQAQQILEQTLDRIPPAIDGPFIPGCMDPNCPYHKPRQRNYGQKLFPHAHLPPQAGLLPEGAVPEGAVIDEVQTVVPLESVAPPARSGRAPQRAPRAAGSLRTGTTARRAGSADVNSGRSASRATAGGSPASRHLARYGSATARPATGFTAQQPAPVVGRSAADTPYLARESSPATAATVGQPTPAPRRSTFAVAAEKPKSTRRHSSRRRYQQSFRAARDGRLQTPTPQPEPEPEPATTGRPASSGKGSSVQGARLSSPAPPPRPDASDWRAPSNSAGPPRPASAPITRLPPVSAARPSKSPAGGQPAPLSARAQRLLGRIFGP